MPPQVDLEKTACIWPSSVFPIQRIKSQGMNRIKLSGGYHANESGFVFF